MAVQFRFVKLHQNKPQDFWNNVLWTDETKVKMFGYNAQQHVLRKPNTAYQHKHLIPTVKHGGGGLMIWACSAATGPGHLAVIESTMNSSVYQSILESNVRPSVWQLKLGWNWVINRTMIPNTATHLQQKVWKRKESVCCNGPVKVQTSIWLKCCGGTLRELCINQRCKHQ